MSQAYERRKPYRLMFTPRPCMRTPRPVAKVMRGACSEGAAWAAWHRFRKRVEMGIASAGTWRLMGPAGEMCRKEVLPKWEAEQRPSTEGTERDTEVQRGEQGVAQMGVAA